MANKFSKALVKRITKYFANYHKKQITEEEAQAYLNSLADFFLVINEPNEPDDSKK